ncbi:MAG: hypothetical protein H0T73_15835 [Ardenticatenales bacterium]|nr:hypothetical protein [Ardenticatenales bacterium]
MKQFTRSLLLCLCLLLLSIAPVLAEGPLSGGTRIYIDKEPLGPFMVTSFAAPNPPVITDNLWVTVQVRDGAKAVTDARIWVIVTPRDGVPQRIEAVHELAASALDYTAYFPVTTPGPYEVRIEMEHPSGTGSTLYPVQVSEPLTSYIFLLMALPFLLVALFLVRRFGMQPLTTQKRVEP